MVKKSCNFSGVNHTSTLLEALKAGGKKNKTNLRNQFRSFNFDKETIKIGIKEKQNEMKTNIVKLKI